MKRLCRLCCFELAAMLSVVAAPLDAQTDFNPPVPGADPPGFVLLTSLPAPANMPGNAQVAMAKLVTNHPGTGASGPKFQIYRPLTGQTAETRPDQPAAAIDDAVSGDNIATLSVNTCAGTPVAAGFHAYCITLQYGTTFAFTAGETSWRLSVEQHTTTAYEYFGFRTDVLSADATIALPLVTKSKVRVDPEMDFMGVQLGISATDAPLQSATVRNVGTAPLTLSSGIISGDPAPAFFTREVYSVVPIDPGGTLPTDFVAGQGIWIRASPRAMGERTATLTITGAPGDAAAITLRVTGLNYYGHLLLDCSGSMSWRPDASTTTVEAETRLFLAKQPARAVNNWVESFTDGLGYFGLTTFPGTCGEASGSVNVKVGIDVSASTQPPIAVKLAEVSGGGIDPRFDGTPMQQGIDAALADMTTRITDPTRPPTLADRPNLRQSMLMLSDGAQHQGDARNSITALQANGIRVYTIGYGVPGGGEVDHALLDTLARGTGGEFWDANANTAFELFNAYKNAIRVWLGLQQVVDPEGVIRAGQTRQHKACVDDRAYGLTFVVEWDRNAPGGVNLTLVTPTGENITPATSGIAYFGDRMFAQYVIRGRRVRGGAGAGEWTMNLSGGAIPSNADTRYSYGVMAQTSLTVERVQGANPSAGISNLMEVRLANWVKTPPARSTVPQVPGGQQPGGDPVPVQPRVTLYFDAPAASYGTWLATNDVPREWLFGAQPRVTRSGFSLVRSLFASQRQDSDRRVPTERDGEPLTIAQRKAWALTRFADKPFVDARTRDSLVLFDDGTHGDRVANDNIYSAMMPAHRYDGVVNLRIDVFAHDTARRTCVQRDLRFSDVVLARLTPAIMRENVAWHRNYDVDVFFDPGTPGLLPEGDPPAGFKRSIVAFTPRDSLGNYWGPGRASYIQFASSNAKVFGPVIDNWDGSYLQVLEHHTDVRPTVAVVAGHVRSDPIELSDSGIPKWLWLLLMVIAIVGFLIWRGRP